MSDNLPATKDLNTDVQGMEFMKRRREASAATRGNDDTPRATLKADKTRGKFFFSDDQDQFIESLEVRIEGAKFNRERWENRKKACESNNGINGRQKDPANPTPECASCPFDNGNDCPDKVQLVFLHKHRETGVWRRCTHYGSATSAGNYAEYLEDLNRDGLIGTKVITRLTATPTISKDGYEYALIGFEAVRALSPEEFQGAEARRQEVLGRGGAKAEMDATGAPVGHTAGDPIVEVVPGAPSGTPSKPPVALEQPPAAGAYDDDLPF